MLHVASVDVGAKAGGKQTTMKGGGEAEGKEGEKIKSFVISDVFFVGNV